MPHGMIEYNLQANLSNSTIGSTDAMIKLSIGGDTSSAAGRVPCIATSDTSPTTRMRSPKMMRQRCSPKVGDVSRRNDRQYGIVDI